MFTLPSLGYEYDALEPHISADIMKLHHQKHHQTYVDKLNAAVASLPSDFQDLPLETLVSRVMEINESLRQPVINHGGGHLNHSLFWKWMTPTGSGMPTGAVADLITVKHGSYEEFQQAFKTAALGLFGSGWVWLMPDGSITTTKNQDNPIMNGHPMPILGLDVWEHAYYLDYYNKRDDYVDAWWKVVDWAVVEDMLLKSN